MAKLKVINLFGGPGVGKSTLAASLFAHMKKEHYNVELVGEYAKDMVYENRSNILADQLYILAKQNRRLSRLQDNGIEWAVTDGPLPLGLIYGADSSSFLSSLIWECFFKYDNYNVFLQRSKTLEYQPDGRVQKTLEEAQAYDFRLSGLMVEHCLRPFMFRVGYDSAETLLYEIKRAENEL